MKKLQVTLVLFIFSTLFIVNCDVGPNFYGDDVRVVPADGPIPERVEILSIISSKALFANLANSIIR